MKILFFGKKNYDCKVEISLQRRVSFIVEIENSECKQRTWFLILFWKMVAYLIFNFFFLGFFGKIN